MVKKHGAEKVGRSTGESVNIISDWLYIVTSRRQDKIESTTSSTGGKAPFPMSPHASSFSTGGMTFTFHSLRSDSCLSVRGWLYISVFIQGAT